MKYNQYETIKLLTRVLERTFIILYRESIWREYWDVVKFVNEMNSITN